MTPAAKNSIEISKKDVEDPAADAKTMIERLLGDVSKKSATQQIIIGASSGWVTGMVAAKIGKMAAVALGGGIIALQIANHQGYITVNWDRVMKRVDKVADKVEQNVSNEAPKWMDKMERFVDRKLDKAEDVLKKNKRKVKNWYDSFVGNDPEFHLEKIHIFGLAFVLGVSVGITTGSI